MFERFRTESMNNFGIEPGHFLSLPGMAYQAFLKTTGVELDYITDEEIYTMLKDNLRGGIVLLAKDMMKVLFIKTWYARRMDRLILVLTRVKKDL